MRKLTIMVFCLSFLLSMKGISENAPITTMGAITNATTGYGGVTVPVTVVNFVSIGSVNLTFKFDTTKVRYVSATPNSAFTGMIVTYYRGTSSSMGKIVISWNATTNITLPDQTHLVDLTFTYIGTTAPLTWLFTGNFNGSPNVCQYKRYISGSSYNTLYDSPQLYFYINGGVSNRAAPVTMAPVIANAVTGDYSIPIKVNNFSNIGAFYLSLEYDSTVLKYLTFTINPTLSGNIAVGSEVFVNGKKIMRISWYGSCPSLANGSTLISLNFHYSNVSGKGSYSTLNWIDTGPTCEYTDNLVPANKLIDFPTTGFYLNGLIHSSSHNAPQTWLPSITPVTPGNLSVSVKSNNFTDVKSFKLSFNYDPNVMPYSGFTPNPLLGGSMTVTDNLPDTTGKRKLTVSWTGTSPQSLADGSTIVTINHTYISGTSALTWVTDTASSRYNEANGNAYYDLPKSDYYQDGVVAPHVAPLTVAWYSTGVVNQTVTVPVKVYHFSNIGSFSLTLDYDPGVLIFVSAALVPSIGGSFNATPQGISRVLFEWSGSLVSLTDSSNLFNMSFTYRGGNSPLAWYTQGSCKYTDGLSSLPALFDQPKAKYYINGSIGSNPVIANFSASTVTPAVNDAVTFNDLSAGSPNGWSWSFNPPTVIYLNGTSSSSQNPQVKFPTNGIYSVTLVASRGISSNLKIRTDYIHAGTPGLWTGTTSSDWYTPTNWHNFLLPANSINVQIPAAPANVPVFNGDFTLGNQCKDLTLTGASQFTINGNFTINTGKSLIFNGSGVLKVSGNWSDSGSFTTGTGSVEFFGENPASILAPVQETFYNLIENKTNTKLSIPNTVTVTGDITVK